MRLCGQPLISYPLEALSQALDDVAVIAKPDTQLPSLPGVTVWIEPPHAAELLRPAAVAAEQPLLEAIVATGPRLLEVEDPEQLFDVNAPEDLLQAAAILDRRRRRWASRT